MENFDFKKYLAENKLTENIKEAEFDIQQELKLGDILVDGEKDRYEVTTIGSNSVELKPLTYKGQNIIFPEDFGDDVDLEDIWGYLNPEQSLKEAETSTEWRDVANILQKALNENKWINLEDGEKKFFSKQWEICLESMRKKKKTGILGWNRTQ
jgi:hypothetical protein